MKRGRKVGTTTQPSLCDPDSETRVLKYHELPSIPLLLCELHLALDTQVGWFWDHSGTLGIMLGMRVAARDQS